MNAERKAAALKLVLDELALAEEIHPSFPHDVIHQIAVLSEETGESVKAALQYVYENGSMKDFRNEVAQVGAMAIRILASPVCQI